jgi:hypothetical protein
MEELWRQASEYRRVTQLNTPEYRSYIYRGIKIIKHNDGEINIYTSHFGDFYREISKEDYEYFFAQGFRAGVYMLCLRNYNKTLDIIKTKISNEVNGRNNQKHYNALRDHRVLVMNKYKDVINLKRETNEHI